MNKYSDLCIVTDEKVKTGWGKHLLELNQRQVAILKKYGHIVLVMSK